MYGTYAGLSQEEINKGINAATNDDWDTSKGVFKNILNGLAKNPNWSVDPVSDAELNVMIAEGKAINDITWIAYQGEQIQNKVNEVIAEKSKPFQELASLNEGLIQYARVAGSSSSEGQFLSIEYDKLLNANDYDSKFKHLEVTNIKLGEMSEGLSTGKNSSVLILLEIILISKPFKSLLAFA